MLARVEHTDFENSVGEKLGKDWRCYVDILSYIAGLQFTIHAPVVDGIAWGGSTIVALTAVAGSVDRERLISMSLRELFADVKADYLERAIESKG